MRVDMALDFRLRDFFHPLAILKLRRELDASQWHCVDEQRELQNRLLRAKVEHAYAKVPFYRRTFDRLGLSPRDVRTVEDLPKLPLLDKDTLRTQREALCAIDKHRYGPISACTSGTTGQRLDFLLDTTSNVLEFVYYWRYWGWAGYRLGDRFAEFSSVFFLKPSRESLLVHDAPHTGRMLLNSVTMTIDTARAHVTAIRRHGSLYLKGLASVLYHFALFVEELGATDLPLRAVFSTGEALLPTQRRTIERVFGCKVYDSYGHMERTVAISECPQGSLHVNHDYGVLELVPVPPSVASLSTSGDTITAKVVGTSLHNWAMPLLRYDTGDLVEVRRDAASCACGRKMPVVERINGRQAEAILTPDGRVVTAAFLVFEDARGLEAGQILQPALDELVVRVAATPAFGSEQEALVRDRLARLCGPTMRIHVDRCALHDILPGGGHKYRSVDSPIARRASLPPSARDAA